MAALVPVLIVLLVSLLITRVATIILTLTGMSTETARFQARSALSGVGFTTSEAEAITTHPVRRRIVLLLMLFGSAGLVTAMAALIITFGGASGRQSATRGLLLVIILLVVWLLSRSSWVDRHLARAIAWVLRLRGMMDAGAHATLLHLDSGYAIHELMVRGDSWCAGRTLDELSLREEGVIVLGVQPARGEYVGLPDGDTRIAEGDRLIVYSTMHRARELDARTREDAATAPAADATQYD